MTPLISVIMPTRPRSSIEAAVASIMAQSCQDFEVHIIVDRDFRGAPWARNQGLDVARGRYVLFSDDDVIWEPEAFAIMVQALEEADGIRDDGWTVGYAYGGYLQHLSESARKIIGNEPWDYVKLRRMNYISTMSLLRATCARRWDTDILRLQDWDLWLTLAEEKIRGVWVGCAVFSTAHRRGITFGGTESWSHAVQVIRKKHRL